MFFVDQWCGKNPRDRLEYVRALEIVARLDTSLHGVKIQVELTTFFSRFSGGVGSTRLCGVERSPGRGLRAPHQRAAARASVPTTVSMENST